MMTEPTMDKVKKTPLLLSYRNRHGRNVPVDITYHGVDRFCERYKRAYGIQLDIPNSVSELSRLFNNSNRVLNFNRSERERLRRYGQDTMFFRRDKLTFVVQNQKIVTVEISEKSGRWKNC